MSFLLGISVHWDESSGLPPIVQVSSKVFPGRPANALIICVNTTIVKGCGLPFSYNRERFPVKMLTWAYFKTSGGSKLTMVR